MHANGAGRGSFASHGGGLRPWREFLISCENASQFRGQLISGGLACLESTQIVILCEAKLQRSPNAFGARPGFQSRIQRANAVSGKRSEMFESLASCFAFHSSTSLNMTVPQDEF